MTAAALAELLLRSYERELELTAALEQLLAVLAAEEREAPGTTTH